MVANLHEMEPYIQAPTEVRRKWIESQNDRIGGNPKEKKFIMLDSISTATNEE